MVALPRVDAVDNARAAIERAVLETLAYSDVFEYPLTAEEAWRSLPLAADLEDVRAALELSPMIEAVPAGPETYYALPGRRGAVATRLRRREASGWLWREARRYGGLIARLPYARMVAITGALAVDNSDDGDDIDFLIVARPGRVWLVRAMTMAIVRLAALRGVTLCPNYLLAEDALGIPERDLYSARELAQMTPISGRETYARMQAANAWWRERLPNGAPRPWADVAGSRQPGWVLEAVTPARLAEALDRLIYARKGAELRGLAAPGSEALFDRGRCKGHFEGHRARIESAVAESLERLEAMV